MNVPNAAGPVVVKVFPPGHHYALKNGDTDPELEKVIKELVLNTEDFIVYLATDLTIQWRTIDEHVPAEHCGEVLNRVAILEAQSQFIEDPVILVSIRRQIAEGLARCLHGNSKEDSLVILHEAEQQLSARNKEMAWKWYFTAAYIVTGVCVLVFVCLWLLRQRAVAFVGTTAFDIILGVLCGALGALLSTTTRANRLVMDANAGRNIHRLEGLSRIGAGLIGALFVALAIKSGLIMGGIQFTGSRRSLLLALCITSGASERLVPSLVEAFEKVGINSDSRSS